MSQKDANGSGFSRSKRSERKHLSRSNSVHSVSENSFSSVAQVDSIASKVRSVVQFHSVDSSILVSSDDSAISVGSGDSVDSVSLLSCATLRRPSQTAAAWAAKRNNRCSRFYTSLYWISSNQIKSNQINFFLFKKMQNNTI